MSTKSYHYNSTYGYFYIWMVQLFRDDHKTILFLFSSFSTIDWSLHI